MWKVIDRFTEWVDSIGSDAGDRMVAGAVIAAIVGGAVCLCVAIALESPVLLGIGFVVLVGHIVIAIHEL